MAEQYSVVARLMVNANNFQKGISKAIGQLNQLQSRTSTVAQSMGSSMKQVGTSMQRTGALMTAGITVPLGLMAKSAISTGVEFDTQMNRVSAIAGATGDEFGALRKQAIELGAATVFSA